MSTLVSGGGKSAKPSFVSYVTPKEIKSEKYNAKMENLPDLLPGEVVFCSACTVLKYTQDEFSQRGVFGTLICTNFRVAFVSDEAASEDKEQLFKNKLYGEKDIPLSCVDNIYGGYEEKRKLLSGGIMKNKFPSKLIIHCKDLRVFQFALTYCKEEDAKRIFQGIVHHCLEPKSLRNIFAFSFCGKSSFQEMKGSQKTMMFDCADDWSHDMQRLKGRGTSNHSADTCRLITENAQFDLSPRLPQFFIVPANVSKEDMTSFQGNGLPIWCWSHHSGCALFKTASLPGPLLQEDVTAQAHMEKMLTAVAHNYLFSVKTEDLSDTLPTTQDIQLSYNKFKQFFLIDNTNDFWESDVKWLSSLENCGWLDIIRQCLHKGVEVVECLEKENTNVLIMEDGGSDLCCVISSLAQLMLDPFYRTLTGFQSLVQKEWVAGGHSFLDRCNQLHLKDKENASPMFLLFLECVWQLVQQYGPAFQFSETYLTVLSDSIHVPIFSTFLFNSQHHRTTFLKLVFKSMHRQAASNLDLSLQAESPTSQRGVLSCPAVWDWSVQFGCKAQELFINPLYAEKARPDRGAQRSQRLKHQRQLSLPCSGFKLSPKRGFFKDEADNLKKMLRVKRISRWMLSPDSQPSSSSAREFYQAWQRRPLDYHGLILPCLDGPWLRLWMQRYLRWIQEVQIFGGGPATVLSKVYTLLDEVQDLRRELEHQKPRVRASPLDTKARSSVETLARSSVVRLSSCFPFTSMRNNSSYKPAIPSSLLHSLGASGGLEDKVDDPVQLESIV